MDPSADAATLARLADLSHDLRSSQANYNRRRDELKEARKELAAAKKALVDFAAGQGAPMPLFDPPPCGMQPGDPDCDRFVVGLHEDIDAMTAEVLNARAAKFRSPVPGNPVTRRECEECNHEIPFDDAPCPDCRGLRFRIVDLDTGKVIQRGRLNPPKKPARKPPQPRPGVPANPGG